MTGLSYVDLDIGSGAAAAVTHLHELGHREIGLVTVAPVLKDEEYGYTTWALNNGMTGTLRALQNCGLRVPDDISIVGLLDDSIAELLTPPITTLTFPSHDMGFEAAKILIGHLTGALAGPQHLLLRPELVVRGSTASVRVASS